MVKLKSVKDFYSLNSPWPASFRVAFATKKIKNEYKILLYLMTVSMHLISRPYNRLLNNIILIKVKIYLVPKNDKGYLFWKPKD